MQEIAGAVDTWEHSPKTARVADKKALEVCRLYNAVVSAIIVEDAGWKLDDGYRNILATMGITEDGAMHNVIGRQAEAAIKERMLEWVRSHGLLIEPDAEDDKGEWMLTGNVRMLFGAEPDIAFEKDGSLAVLIEVKGGKDPAGAIKKTFDEAPVDCKNFLVVGIVTAAMRKRLGEMRMEAHFAIDPLLADAGAWTKFMNEIFHHGLRIAPEAKSPDG